MEWNVVVTTRGEGFEQAEAELGDLGAVSRTDFFNVLVMDVDDPDAFVRRLADRARLIPDLMERTLSRVTPARRCFDFRSAEEFEERASRVAREIAPDLAGKSFYVRVHRRGFQDTLSSHEEERLIAEAVFEELEKEGLDAEVDFDDPDAVLAVETVGPRAGVAVWSREDLEAYPFLDPG